MNEATPGAAAAETKMQDERHLSAPGGQHGPARGLEALRVHMECGDEITPLYTHAALATSPLPTAPAGAREAMELALLALHAMQMEARIRNCGLRICDEAIASLRAALAAAPLDRIALSEERIMDLTRDECRSFRWPSSAIAIVRLAEAEHGIKGGE